MSKKSVPFGRLAHLGVPVRSVNPQTFCNGEPYFVQPSFEGITCRQCLVNARLYYRRFARVADAAIDALDRQTETIHLNGPGGDDFSWCGKRALLMEDDESEVTCDECLQKALAHHQRRVEGLAKAVDDRE